MTIASPIFPLKKLLMEATVLQGVAQFVILLFLTSPKRVSSIISPAPSGVKASVKLFPSELDRENFAGALAGHERATEEKLAGLRCDRRSERTLAGGNGRHHGQRQRSVERVPQPRDRRRPGCRRDRQAADRGRDVTDLVRHITHAAV